MAFFFVSFLTAPAPQCLIPRTPIPSNAAWIVAVVLGAIMTLGALYFPTDAYTSREARAAHPQREAEEADPPGEARASHPPGARAAATRDEEVIYLGTTVLH